MAKQLFEGERWVEAAQEFGAAYSRTSDPSMLFNMALCYRRGGEAKRAFELYRRYLVEAPDSPRRPTVEAKIHELEQELAQVSATTAAATAAEHEQEGKRLYEAGQWADAAKEFEAVYAVNRDPALLYNLALCYRRGGEMEKAIDRYRRYLREVPDSPKRGAVEARIKEMEEELAVTGRQVQSTTRPGPASAGAATHDAEGRRLFEAGRWGEAGAAFEAAYGETRDPTLHYNIALCYRKAGNARKALDHYQKYLAKVPDAANRETVETRISELQRDLANGGARAPVAMPMAVAEDTVDVCDPPCGVGRMCMPSGACLVPGSVAVASASAEPAKLPTVGPTSFLFGIAVGYAAGGSVKVSRTSYDADGGFLFDLYFDRIVVSGLSLGAYFTRTSMSAAGLDTSLWSLGATVKGRIRMSPAVVLRPGLAMGYNHMSSDAFGDEAATGLNIGVHVDLSIATNANVAVVPRLGIFSQPSGGYQSVDITFGPHVYIAVGLEFGR